MSDKIEDVRKRIIAAAGTRNVPKTAVHDPGHSVRKGWKDTGAYIRSAMDVVKNK